MQLQLNLREARWGTLITTCRALLSVRLVLVCWDMKCVLGAAPAVQADEAAETLRAQAVAMTEAVRSPRFWEYMCGRSSRELV